MGRGPRCSKDGLNKGAWLAAEDKLLLGYIKNHGEGKWSNVAKETGLKRCGKSCRLRWMNYLRPDIKRGCISDDEEELIIRLHKLLGNRWSLIAGRLPGRTDNEIKNYWNSNLAKKMSQAAAQSSPSSSQSKYNNNVIIPKTTPDQAEAQLQCPSDSTVIPPQPIPIPTSTTTTTTVPLLHHKSNNNNNCDISNSVAVNSVDSQMSSEEGSPSTTTTTTGDSDDQHSPTNFMMDFSADDHEDFCKILDCDFANLENAIDGDRDHHSGSILVLPKQMIMDKNIQAADFGSLASFLESDEDWLGNDLNVMLS